MRGKVATDSQSEFIYSKSTLKTFPYMYCERSESFIGNAQDFLPVSENLKRVVKQCHQTGHF